MLITLLVASSAAAAPRGIADLAFVMDPTVAKCVVEREPELVAELLHTLPGSEQEPRSFRKLETRLRPCFDPDGRVAGWLETYDRAGIRAGVVLARLRERRDAWSAEAPSSGRMALFATDPGATEPANAVPLTSAQIGDCLVRKHWAAVRSFATLATERKPGAWTRLGVLAIEREKEAAAQLVNAVVPSLPACVPAGTKMRINPLALQRLLLEAFFQLDDAT